MMTETKACPKCRAPLPENAPAGLCPTCLMQAGLACDADVGSTPGMKPTTLASGFVPPEPEDLAKHFPQLEIIELLGKGGMGGWVALSMEPWNVCHWQRIRRARRFNHVEASSNSQPVLKCATVIHSTGVRMQVARRARQVRLDGS